MSRNFNLLKPTLPPPTVWDKVYDWVLFNARIVVLITELLIFVAFVGKIVVDTQAKNKDKEIALTTQQLTFYDTTNQSLYNEIQLKNDNYLLIWNQSGSYNKILQEIFSYINNPGPQIVIGIDANQTTISGYSSLDDLKSLETSMKQSPTFTNVHISDLSLQKIQAQTNSAQYVLIATIINSKRAKLSI